MLQRNTIFKSFLILDIVATFFVVAFVGFTTFHYGSTQYKTYGHTQYQTDQGVDMKLHQYSDKGTILTKITTSKYTSATSTVTAALTAKPNAVINTAAVAINACGLNFGLVSDVSTVKQGDKITYTMSVGNQGSASCQNTTISLYYSDNEKYVSAIPKATAVNYYWDIGTLAAGVQKTFTVVTQANQNTSNDINTEGCASSDNSLDACAFNDITISSASSPLTIIPNSTPTPTPTQTSPTIATSANKEYGTWVWVSPLQMSQTYMNSILDAAKANGINVMYVTIDDYLNIYALPDGPDKLVQQQQYGDALQTLITAANARGISIDAETGWRDWAESDQTYKAFAIVNYVMQYNNTHTTNPLRGLQYDIEPYLLPTYNTHKAALLTDFISLVSNTTARLGNSNLSFSVVIPHFYDDVEAWTPLITYNGVTDYTFNQLITILDKRPNSSILLMSYRNFAEGDNGSIQISNTEVTEASDGSHTTKVIVAQETGNVTPSYVTFYNLSKAYYLQQIGIIQNTFKNMSNFGGMAVHYIDPFLKLK